MGLSQAEVAGPLVIASLQKASPAAEVPVKYFSDSVNFVSYFLPPFPTSWMGLIV